MNPLIITIFHAPVGLNVLNGGLILALMSVPIIVSIGEDAFNAVPDSYREAALALGVTRWQMVYRVLLPAAMAVLMATGHAVAIPTSVLDSVRTLTATIAAELGEAPVGSQHYQVLFVIGILLFSITFAVNLAADLAVRGVKNR
jgi:phosphate transport system permease protein